MALFDQCSKTDRAIGTGGLILAFFALVSTTQNIEVSGDAEVVPAAIGALMILGVLVVTVRHHRVHRGGRGRGWLIAGWAVLGVNVVWALFQALETAAFDDGFWRGLQDLATSPPIVVVLAPLVLSSIAMLRDGRGQQADSRSPDSGKPATVSEDHSGSPRSSAR